MVIGVESVLYFVFIQFYIGLKGNLRRTLGKYVTNKMNIRNSATNSQQNATNTKDAEKLSLDIRQATEYMN